jgi:hypothetical protein
VRHTGEPRPSCSGGRPGAAARRLARRAASGHCRRRPGPPLPCGGCVARSPAPGRHWRPRPQMHLHTQRLAPGLRGPPQRPPRAALAAPALSAAPS